MTIQPMTAGDERRVRRGQTITIESREQYARAAGRSRQLSDYPEGTAEATELAALVEAMLAWEPVPALGSMPGPR